MGSGSSRPKAAKFKRRLSSFLCGSSSSRATAETEDYPVELLVNSAGCIRSLPDNSQAKHKDSILRSREGIEITSPKFEQGEGWLFENAQGDTESANKGKHCTADNEPSTSSTSCSEEQSSRDVLLASGVNDLEYNGSPESSTGDPSVARLPRQELRSVHLERAGIEGSSDVQTGIVDSNPVASPAVSRSNIGSWSLVDDSIQVERRTESGFLLSDRTQGSTEGNVLHVDVLSISSANFSGNSNEIVREARRNSRRMFWDAYSSRNSRRHADSPNILFARDDADYVGSSRSWLLDFGSNNMINDGMSDDLWHLGRRSHLASERMSHSRSELWERLRGGTGERGGRVVCPSGLHPDGSCLCGLEDTGSSQSSVSRVVMLAEALFEVLDELHRQPTSFALSVFSKPAPESAVDSLPVKSYEKSTAVENGDDVEQCYICLEEYETGDKMRVLPCSHEYHMTCVDKWLKEIHGVCPLCRGNIRQGTTESLDGSSMPVDVL